DVPNVLALVHLSNLSRGLGGASSGAACLCIMSALSRPRRSPRMRRLLFVALVLVAFSASGALGQASKAKPAPAPDAIPALDKGDVTVAFRPGAAPNHVKNCHD